MSKKYYYEDEDGLLKDNTRNSSAGLRTLASLSLGFGIIVGTLIIIIGFMGIKLGHGSSQLTGISAAIVAVLVYFYGYVNYVIISAVATFVENSDRSDVVDAIHELAAAVRKEEIERKEDDVELPKIDISDME